MDWMVLLHYNQCPTLFRSILVIWLGAVECISPTAVFNDLLIKLGSVAIDFASSCLVS